MLSRILPFLLLFFRMLLDFPIILVIFVNFLDDLHFFVEQKRLFAEIVDTVR